MTVDYQVLLTPLDETGRAYGTRVDVTKDVDISDYLKKSGITPIRRELDRGDYDIGVFNYNSISFNLNNSTGKFNEPRLDSRSMFPSYRDRAIAEIYFIDSDSNKTISYEGLLTEKATRQNLSDDSIKFTFLGLESIFQQSVVNSGTIINGVTISQAFRSILDIPLITSILNFNVSNINPELDLVIDNGATFDNKTVKQAVDLLLVASNSILIIDESRNIVVKSRTANSNTPHSLYLNDIQKRDNILSADNYNSGLQRMFNVLIIDGESFKNSGSIAVYTERSKNLSLGFITSTSKKQQIANAIFSEFALPKDELIVGVEKKIATSFEILDKITVSYNKIIRSHRDNPVPLYEIDEYGKSYYPNEIGGFRIDGRRVFKIIGIYETPATFNIAFKLRDTGELTA